MNILNVLRDENLLPVVTFSESDNLDEFGEFLIAQNVLCIEITLRTSFAFTAIKHFKAQFGDQMKIGAGTVINTCQVEDLAKIEADFIVSPGLSEKVTAAARSCNVPLLPGVSTPTEVIQALELGLDVLKFFPAHLNGGIPTIKAFGHVFPQVSFCPTGGITQETSKNYLALANVFAVGGSWFQKDFHN